MRASVRSCLIAAAAGAGLAGCVRPEPQGTLSARPVEEAALDPAQRRAFFGETHLHTALSFDAWPIGVKTTPDQAYRFGRGEPILAMGVQVRRAWPLDFMAVTDHAEWLGVLNELDDPSGALARSELGTRMLARPGGAGRLAAEAAGRPETAGAMRSAWAAEVAAANANYVPGRFTTFIAYEWTSMKQGKFNLHRNVIFNGDHAPAPFTAAQSDRPEDLWTYLEATRRSGVDVLAIPHNGNVSGGLMFDGDDSDGRPIDAAYAARRTRNEPLFEVIQNKGQSETLPILSPNDEFANFAVYDRLLTNTGERSPPHGGYVREALGRGLEIEARTGANPFRYGFVGGSDIHNGLSISTQADFMGGPFGTDPATMRPSPAQARRILGEPPSPDAPAAAKSSYSFPILPIAMDFRPGGVTGVWAEANTRSSIFAALKRKETWATSGTRIRVRIFGGWDLPADFAEHAGWAAGAYGRATPMGGELRRPPRAGATPAFAFEALKDPDGAGLDRVQVIKLWLAGGGFRERIFDVALSDGRAAPRFGRAPPIRATLDVRTGRMTGARGAPRLSGVWRDPQFDAATPAVYYARVIEAPSPRWSALLAIRERLPLPAGAPATIQERAWTSPIWYSPAR
jgi:hypothetical protein